MKKSISIIATTIALITFYDLSISAQILHPVHWSYAAKKINKNETVIFLKATIDGDWHIYSTKQPDGGPQKTEFKFNEDENYTLNGDVSEPTPVKKFEKVFNMDVFYFPRSVIFQQKIRIKPGLKAIKGSVHFMTCNNEKCLPPDDVDFTIPIK
jgi:hypothetical protein